MSYGREGTAETYALFFPNDDRAFRTHTFDTKAQAIQHAEWRGYTGVLRDPATNADINARQHPNTMEVVMVKAVK